VANYSAVIDSVIVEIPVSAVRRIPDEIDGVRANMNRLVLRRLARFYCTSLSTTGTNESKVAAALVSRLALRGEDAGTIANSTSRRRSWSDSQRCREPASQADSLASVTKG